MSYYSSAISRAKHAIRISRNEDEKKKAQAELETLLDEEGQAYREERETLARFCEAFTPRPIRRRSLPTVEDLGRCCRCSRLLRGNEHGWCGDCRQDDLDHML